MNIFYNYKTCIYFKEVSNQNECVLCQFVMKLATNYIAKNSTEVQDP